MRFSGGDRPCALTKQSMQSTGLTALARVAAVVVGGLIAVVYLANTTEGFSSFFPGRHRGECVAE